MRDIVDPVLGPLRWNPPVQSLEGNVQMGAADIELSIEMVDEGSMREQLDRAYKVVATMAPSVERARSYAAQEMLWLKNDGYLEEGESPLSEDEFAQRLKFGLLSILLEGPCCFVFDDDDMLWGHHVTVDSEDDGTPLHVEMWG